MSSSPGEGLGGSDAPYRSTSGFTMPNVQSQHFAAGAEELEASEEGEEGAAPADTR